MDKGYIHVEIESSQLPKKAGRPCGDVVAYERTTSSTTLIVSDGMGSGIRANIAAQVCVSRLQELLRQGYSLRNAFASAVNTMNKARGTDQPYAVFTVVRILSDGVATVLSYEMPPPIFVTARYAQALNQRTITLENALVGEANCFLEPGEGIIVMSDGITQAGLGSGLTHGWTLEGARQYIADCLSSRARLRDIPKCVVDQARKTWKTGLGDDMTVALALCRRGKTVNILTGPPSNPTKDKPTVKRFMAMEGTKVVSGGTTAKIVADALGREMKVQTTPEVLMAPAEYSIEGIDLVTEGAVTLNQVYNILDMDPDSFDEDSGVTRLQGLLWAADRVNFLIGGAINPANRGISFRQMGILSRQTIIPLIAEKLRSMGKLVVCEHI